jgi:hypothetical protein
MMRLGAAKAQVKTDRAAQNEPGTRYCFRITHGRFYERVSLFFSVEDPWPDLLPRNPLLVPSKGNP